MGLRNKLRRMIKGFRLRRLLFLGNGRKKPRNSENGKRASWMMHVSHGYQVVELDKPLMRDEFDSVVVQREQTQDHSELWFFGVFDDANIAEGVTKYMQSHFFDKMPKGSRMEKKSKEALEMAHRTTRSILRDRDQTGAEIARKSGLASAMVINSDKLVMSSVGGYRVVVCIDGKAYQISTTRRHWSHNIIPGTLRVPKGSASELVVGSERIDSQTEFVILASYGVWQVMEPQEAVNLIGHIEDAQAAAECLAYEALNRMSRSRISCLIIRFD